MFQRKKKIDIPFIALIQTFGVIIYCTLIAGLFRIIAEISPEEPAGFLGSILILSLLVFSAAITGSLVFGYPAYLALTKRIKEALSVLAHTFLFGLVVIVVVLFVVVVLGV